MKGTTLYFFLEEVFAALRRIAIARPALFWLGFAMVSGILLRLIWLVIAAVFLGSGDHGPAFLKVYGSVLYEDGTAIPAPSLMLSFLPCEAVGVRPSGGRTGSVRVDSASGSFASLLAYQKSATGMPMYRVCLLAGPQEPLPISLVPTEYSQSNMTPLQVDVTSSPLEIRVRRPGKK